MARKLANRPHVALKMELKRKVGYDDEDQVIAVTRKGVAALNLAEANKGAGEDDIEIDR
jgi:hypothetical protein